MRSPPGALCEIQKRHREYHRTRSSQALTRGLSQVQYRRRATRPNVPYGSPKLQNGNARLKRKSLLTSKHARTLLALRSRTLRYQSGGALQALAMYRRSTGCRDRLSIDLRTESMPELEPGTDHHRDNKQDQRVGEGGRDQVLQWASGRRGGWLVQRVRHQRSVTVDVGRYHGQQIDRGDDDQEENSDADDDRWPDRSQTRYRDVDDDQQSDPCDQRTIGIADDRLNECIGVGAAMEEAPQPMKPAHTRTKPLKGPSARNAQMPPRTAILKERAITCVMAYLPCDVLCGGAALRMTCIVAVLSLQAQI